MTQNMEPRTVQDHSNGWCCVDCLMLLANGETPPEMDEEETAAWLAGIDEVDGEVVSLGLMYGEDGCECSSDDVDADFHSENCETQDFSWRQCDVCHSTLGGSRHAVTFWFDAES